VVEHSLSIDNGSEGQHGHVDGSGRCPNQAPWRPRKVLEGQGLCVVQEKSAVSKVFEELWREPCFKVDLPRVSFKALVALVRQGQVDGRERQVDVEHVSVVDPRRINRHGHVLERPLHISVHAVFHRDIVGVDPHHGQGLGEQDLLEHSHTVRVEDKAALARQLCEGEGGLGRDSPIFLQFFYLFSIFFPFFFLFFFYLFYK
jgi:hypothetical protein